MPQGPFQTTVLANATHTKLNISSETVVKTSNGNVASISVVVAGSAAGAVYDAATTGTATSANLIAVIPDVAGVYTINFPVSNGIVVAPGTGQTVAVSYT
jgi:endoglucanase Acf2